MITAKQLYGTYAHQQMRMYIDLQFPELPQFRRSGKLGCLVTKFLKNCNELGGWDGQPHERVPRSIDEGFVWGNSPQGHDFWSAINDMRPIENAVPPAQPNPAWAGVGALGELLGKPAKVKVKVPKAPAPAAKKKVGWW